MPRAAITLTTDFGLRDSYVAEMKAVILSLCPDATIVDISHEIRKFDIRMGAYVLASASTYFQKGTVHVAVVDPGVGTERKPILVKTKKAVYVGPDNGVLALAASTQGVEHIYEMANRKLMLSSVSVTFHGRDIFAPAAAHIANGTPLSDFGPEIHHMRTPRFASHIKRKGKLIGEIIYVDGFGNIVTNLSREMLMSIDGETITVKLKEQRLSLRLCKAYADVKRQDPLGIIGSHGLLEISVNQGSAVESYCVKIGDKVELSLPKEHGKELSETF